MVYSSVSDITWTGDANLLRTLKASNPNLVNTIISTVGSIADTPNPLDTPANSGSYTLTTADFGANGSVNWFGAKAYVSYLNTINYAGSNQWALPSTDANSTGSQLGQLFYNELGGSRSSPMPDTANFTNVHDEHAYYAYWPEELASGPLATRGTSIPTMAPAGINGKRNQPLYAWAVSPGNVAAVPVPAAIWLFGSGLIGLLGLKRRGNIG